MKTNILKCCAAALVLAGGVSCTDLLDMTPTNLVSDKTMWEKTENAEWAVNSLYTYVYSVVANQSVVGLTESLTDMMKYGSYNYNSQAFIPSEFAYGEDTPSKPAMSTPIWAIGAPVTVRLLTSTRLSAI